MYGNAPRAVWSRWSPPDELNRIKLSCRALLLRTDDGQNLLFETGIGAFFDPKLRQRFGVTEPDHRLLANLAHVGVRPGEIDAVILSHLHFDHAGGMLSAHGDGLPRLVFPRARVYVGARHWARALDPHPRDRASFIPVLHELLAASGRLVLVGDDGATDLAPLVTFRFSDGHTPGLMMAEIALASGPLQFVADLIPGIPWVHPPITMGYDRFPELVIDEKQATLSRLASQSGKIYFTHDPDVACAAVTFDAEGRFRATPVSLDSL